MNNAQIKLEPEVKITLITACVNRASTLEDSIRSVIGQDYPDIEYIIVDGASSDGTLDIIRRYEMLTGSEDFRQKHPNFTFHYISEPDEGMYEAINKGLRVSTGDVIGLIHSDDFFPTQHTLTLVADIFSKGNVDMVYGNGVYVSYENTSEPVRVWVSGKYSKHKVRTGWLPLHPTCFLSRKFHEQVGLYNEDYKIASDTDFLIRAMYEHSPHVVYLNETLVYMRMGGLSTTNHHRLDVWREDIAILRSHGFMPLPTKLMKMMRKVPQYVSAKFKRHV